MFCTIIIYYLKNILRESKKKGMLTRKQCPRCGGNIYSSADYYGSYEQCLQCGYTCDLDVVHDHQEQLELDSAKEPSTLI